jgi:uncharacterized membrane protein YhhN
LSPILLLSSLCMTLVVALLVGEYLDRQGVRYATKPLASACFVIAGVLAADFGVTYDVAVVVGLVLGALGDVLLIPRSQRVFLGGIVSFLLSHVAYAAAFGTLGLHLGWVLGATAALLVLAATLGRWFVAKAPAKLKGAVAAYVLVISVMVALASGAVGAGASTLLLVAAVAFYVSDLSVAMHRFVEPKFVTRAWGLPLYYSAQLLFVQTLGGA